MRNSERCTQNQSEEAFRTTRSKKDRSVRNFHFHVYNLPDADSIPFDSSQTVMSCLRKGFFVIVSLGIYLDWSNELSQSIAWIFVLELANILFLQVTRIRCHAAFYCILNLMVLLFMYISASSQKT